MRVVGLDTETIDGYARLIASSTGRVRQLHSWAEAVEYLMGRDLQGSLNFWYNLRYDFQAILKWSISIRNVRDRWRGLWEDGEADIEGVAVRYIPDKFFSLSIGKHTTRFFDLAQFYESSLDEAAALYIGERKGDYAVVRLRESDLTSPELMAYLIQDANLCQKLGALFVRKLSAVGLDDVAPFSAGYLAEQYFTGRVQIPGIDDVPDGAIEAVGLSFDGGRFEMLQRGYLPCAWEYDLNSAYPAEIKRLPDISLGAWKYRKAAPSERAGLGAVTVDLAIDTGEIVGPIMSWEPQGGKMLYAPVGRLRGQTISLSEYRALRANPAVRMDVTASWSWEPEVVANIFAREIDELYAWKAALKGKDAMLYNVVKKIQNSLYGKFLQERELPDGTILGGRLWNPIYGAEITARIRGRVYDLARTAPEAIIAFATDSVISSRPLLAESSSKLGDFALTESGPAVSVLSGLYEIADKSRSRGYGRKAVGKKLRFILELAGRNGTISIDETHVVSLGDVLTQTGEYEFDDLNRFIAVERRIDLNGDTKRLWPARMSGWDLLEKSQRSIPLIAAG
jgi:hypothetical protein